MSNAAEGKVVTAQGRIVWTCGRNLFEGEKKLDMNTRQVRKDAQGNDMMQFGFGLAIPVTELVQGKGGFDLWAAMHEQARMMFPSGQIPPGFAMKYKDGVNGIDDKGRPFAQREGYSGCLIFALTTSLPIRFFKWENGTNIQVADGIKCGDYVNVQIMVKSHAAFGQGKAGLYLNPMAVQLIAPGKEIVNAPSADVIFGQAPPPVPSNYVPPDQPVMPHVAMPPSAPGGFPAPVPTAPVAPAVPPPYHNVLPPQHQPPPGGVPVAAVAHPTMPPPPPVGATMPAPVGYVPPIPGR